MNKNKINEFIDRLVNGNKIVVLTGAGISTLSGIPDFRSPAGIYSKYDPFLIFDLNYFKENPQYFYSYAKQDGEKIFRSKPNIVHFFISELEKKGIIQTIITQNIDNLHQKAGSKNIIELHGNINKSYCLECWQEYDTYILLKKIEFDSNIPLCEKCGGLIKPRVIFFSEPLPEKELKSAEKVSKEADLCIIMGSSLSVAPANKLPFLTLQNNGSIAIFNIQPTYIDDKADFLFNEDFSIIIPKMIKILSGMNILEQNKFNGF